MGNATKTPRLPQRTLTWRREPRERGLRRIGQVRGWQLFMGPNLLASVSPQFRGFSRVVEGYGMSARKDSLGVPWANTFGSSLRSSECEAMLDAERHVFAALSPKYRLRFKRPDGWEAHPFSEPAP